MILATAIRVKLIFFFIQRVSFFDKSVTSWKGESGPVLGGSELLSGWQMPTSCFRPPPLQCNGTPSTPAFVSTIYSTLGYTRLLFSLFLSLSLALGLFCGSFFIDVHFMRSCVSFSSRFIPCRDALGLLIAGRHTKFRAAFFFFFSLSTFNCTRHR